MWLAAAMIIHTNGAVQESCFMKINDSHRVPSYSYLFKICTQLRLLCTKFLSNSSLVYDPN